MCVNDFKSLLLELGVSSDIVCTLNGLLLLPGCTAQNSISCMFAEECFV